MLYAGAVIEVRVVASLSALWPLAKEGFSADYCVALDPSPSLYNQFAGLEDSLKGTPWFIFQLSIRRCWLHGLVLALPPIQRRIWRSLHLKTGCLGANW